MADLALVIDNSQAVRDEALTWPERARALIVRTSQEYEQAGDLLKGIKALRARIADTFDPHISRAYDAHKALVAEKKTAEAPLTEAEGIIKRTLVSYTEEQERIRREEQRRLEELARQQEEARRLAEAAALEQAGEHEAASEVFEEAVTAPAPVIILPPATPKVAGISYRENWKAEVTDLKALVRAAAQNDQLLALLQPNTVALGQMVRAMKDRLNTVPGVKAWNDTVVSASRR